MPELWLRLGHKGTQRILVGFVYREHTPWNSKENASSQKSQEHRLQKWLLARRSVWRGKEEVIMTGDINIDWLRMTDSNIEARRW